KPMRLARARTLVRATAVLAAASLTIDLLSALAPAGQASPSKHPASANPAARTITELIEALTGARQVRRLHFHGKRAAPVVQRQAQYRVGQQDPAPGR